MKIVGLLVVIAGLGIFAAVILSTLVVILIVGIGGWLATLGAGKKESSGAHAVDFSDAPRKVVSLAKSGRAGGQKS